MIIERIYDDLLAHAGYLVAGERCRRCIVIDPHRDIAAYLHAATLRRLAIAAVAETHIHADFVSGARALARQAGAELILSGEGSLDWKYKLARDEPARFVHDGDVIDIDALSLRVRHTPGHTPEHVVFIATDTSKGAQPVGMFSGDFIFAGDVGRPDLLERAANARGTMEPLARDLFHSLRALANLPDYLQIWPGHGAGSACGKALDSTPSTTLGYERLVNWAFQTDDEDEFVRDVLGRQTEPPKYFARMKAVNRDAPPVWESPRALDTLSAEQLRTAIDAGTIVVDVRATAAYAQGHVPGTINLPLGGSFLSWAGTLLNERSDIVIVADSADAMTRARRALALIGIDRVVSWADTSALTEWEASAGLESTPSRDPQAVNDDADRVILDVRGDGEWKDGHVPGATHIYLGDLPARAAELPQDQPIVVHCQGGSRASIAASILRARGFTDVQLMNGGFGLWERLDLPVERGSPTD